MERPTCSTCVFFAASHKECHRYPPTKFGNVMDGRVHSSGDEKLFTIGVTQFPVVVESDWCGEHPDFPVFVASLRAADTHPD